MKACCIDGETDVVAEAGQVLVAGFGLPLGGSAAGGGLHLTSPQESSARVVNSTGSGPVLAVRHTVE